MPLEGSQTRLALIAVSTVLWGCVPFGDCWPPVTANIRVSPEFTGHLSSPIVIAGVPRIYDADVSGVDDQGIPVPQDRLAPFATGAASGAAHAATLTFRGYPYPTWYVAFLDLNENRSLDPGEPFGVDPRNALDTGCDPHSTTIEIDTLRTSPIQQAERAG
jgi:hypothetical protein